MAVEIDVEESGLDEQVVKDNLPDFARDLLVNGGRNRRHKPYFKGGNMDLKQMIKKREVK